MRSPPWKKGRHHELHFYVHGSGLCGLDVVLLPGPAGMDSGSRVVTLQQERMIQKARERDGDITPCSGKTWAESFTVYGDEILLWYNAGRDTHSVLEYVETEEVHGQAR